MSTYVEKDGWSELRMGADYSGAYGTIGESKKYTALNFIDKIKTAVDEKV